MTKRTKFIIIFLVFAFFGWLFDDTHQRQIKNVEASSITLEKIENEEVLSDSEQEAEVTSKEKIILTTTSKEYGEYIVSVADKASAENQQRIRFIQGRQSFPYYVVDIYPSSKDDAKALLFDLSKLFFEGLRECEYREGPFWKYSYPIISLEVRESPESYSRIMYVQFDVMTINDYANFEEFKAGWDVLGQ